MAQKSVGIWIRVSTEDQAQGDSPEHHEKRARSFVESKGWNVAKVYHLEAVSGKSVKEHPEAKRMLQDVRNKIITGLVFSKLARLARNTIELLEFADQFNNAGAELISLEGPIDTLAPAGKMLYTMNAALAQWEREEIASRVAASVPIRAKLGKPLGGQAPFGYQWDKKVLKIDPVEAPIRKLIYELFVKLKRKKTVAEELNKRGHRTRNGSEFSDTTVDRLLRDPMAKGVRRSNYTKSTGDGKQWALKPSEDWVLTECPAIVSEELWQACNSILDEQTASRKPRGKASAHLFTGLVFCGCGAKMYVAPRSSNYICTGCKKSRIPKVDLEEIYYEQLKGFLLTKEDLSTFNKRGDQEIKAREKEIGILTSDKTKIKADMDKLVDLHLQGGIPTSGFKTYFDPLEERMGQIEPSIQKLQSELEFLKIQVLNGEYILSNAENLYEKWPTMLPEEQRRVVEDLTVSLIIENDEITINFMHEPDLLQNEQNSQRIPMHAVPFWKMHKNVPNALGIIQLHKDSPIGLHIRKKRLELHMNQEDAAKKLGVTEACIWLWENLQAKPQIHYMPEIIHFLGYCPVQCDGSTLAGRIKSYRLFHGLSCEGLGEKLGIGGGAISYWENGGIPKPKRLKMLETILAK